MTDRLRLPAALLARAAAPYRSAGLHPWLFACGKLRGDPVFAALLRLGLIPSHSRLLDLGCGQGLLAALLYAAADADTVAWPHGWSDAPRAIALQGIDHAARDVRWARHMAASSRDRRASMDFVQADIRRVAFAEQDVVVLLDVLHYLAPNAQEALLARVRDCLVPGGRLLVRVADARAGFGFAAGLLVDRLVLAMRGALRPRLHGRPLAEWQLLLQSLGFSLHTHPMHAGTPFANLLLVGQLDRSTEPSERLATSS